MAKIAILTTPEGHFSIAVAMQEALQEAHETELLSISDSIFKLYVPIYQFFPTMYRVPYQFTQRTSVAAAITKLLRRKLMRKVSQFVESSQPDLIICTNYIFLPALESLQLKNRIPILNVITDPWTVHPLLISEKAESNLLFDEHVLDICRSLNDKATYDVTGWFVRKDFYAQPNPTRLQKKLMLDTKQKTIVIAGGSEGTMMILKLIPALMQLKKPINVIVLCGNNNYLQSSIKSFSQIISTVFNQTRVIPIGFTTHVADYLALADVVIGKAGPNTIFESVAAKKPFIAITHITGQEDGNLDLIDSYQIGFVEENAMKVVKLLQSILKNPTRLTKLQKPINALAATNAKASTQLLRIVEDIIKKNAPVSK